MNDVATHTKFTGISLCSGIGMLDAGLNLALGGKFRPLLHVEREAFCAANLAWQMGKKFLDEAPIWDDVRTVTSAECGDYVRTALGGRRLDFIIGGIPCQPYSQAGKRGGGNDERDLWPAALEAIKVYEPCFVFIENVEGMASHVDGARRFLQDLEGAGYRSKAGLFSSKECGASHGRKRWFFFGIAEGCERSDLGNSAFQYNNGKRETGKRRRRKFTDNGKLLADAIIAGLQGRGFGRNGGRECPIGESSLELPRYAPARNDFESWAVVAEMDAARMPAIESKIRGVADGLANLGLQLHTIGNGVDPLVAAYAFCTLWACMQKD